MNYQYTFNADQHINKFSLPVDEDLATSTFFNGLCIELIYAHLSEGLKYVILYSYVLLHVFYDMIVKVFVGSYPNFTNNYIDVTCTTPTTTLWSSKIIHICIQKNIYIYLIFWNTSMFRTHTPMIIFHRFFWLNNRVIRNLVFEMNKWKI
jgi:hypothetical protein